MKLKDICEQVTDRISSEKISLDDDKKEKNDKIKELNKEIESISKQLKSHKIIHNIL